MPLTESRRISLIFRLRRSSRNLSTNYWTIQILIKSRKWLWIGFRRFLPIETEGLLVARKPLSLRRPKDQKQRRLSRGEKRSLRRTWTRRSSRFIRREMRPRN